MFERFTERARQVITLAQDEARYFGADHVGTEHILLGLLREEEGIAARVLGQLGVTLDAARACTHRHLSGSVSASAPQLPLTPLSVGITHIAVREALAIGHNYIGTEHILLALVHEKEGRGYDILRRLGVEEEKVREAVLAHLTGPGRKPRVRVTRVPPRQVEDEIHLKLPGHELVILSLADAQLLHAALADCLADHIL